MRALVTGATGLLGANVVRRLLGDGHRVRVGLRSSSDRRGIDGLDVEEVPLYLDREETLREAVRDCQIAIHAAAAVWVGRTGREELQRANVDGTDALCRAAADGGVRRVVHVSSVDALGIRTLEQPADEETPPNLQYLDCGYVDTKREAEEVVLRWVERGLDAVIVDGRGRRSRGRALGPASRARAEHQSDHGADGAVAPLFRQREGSGRAGLSRVRRRSGDPRCVGVVSDQRLRLTACRPGEKRCDAAW